MKFRIAIFVAFVFCSSLDAQTKVKLYTTADGKLYTQKQLDSIAALKKKTDSVYNSVFYYDSSASLSSFKKKFKDKPLSRINLKSLTGEEMDTDQFKSKVVVIYFWTPSCGPCIAGFPQLNKLKEKYANDVHFISIAPDTKQDVQFVLNKFRFEFKTIADAESLIKELDIVEYPKMFFVDKKGIVRIIEEGVPVKTKPDGSLDRLNGKIQFTAFERYAPFLDEMIKSR